MALTRLPPLFDCRASAFDTLDGKSNWSRMVWKAMKRLHALLSRMAQMALTRLPPLFDCRASAFDTLASKSNWSRMEWRATKRLHALLSEQH